MKPVHSILLLPFLVSCAPDITETEFYRLHPDDDGQDNVSVQLGTWSDASTAIELSAEDSLRSGVNVVDARLTVGGSPAPAGSELTLLPVWHSNGHELPNPLGASAATATDTEGLFRATPFFLTPRNESGYWTLRASFSASGQTGEATFDVDVHDALWVQFVESAQYYVSWVVPVRPRVGQDDLQLALHHRTTDGFAPITDATIGLYPYMDMGAGEGHSTPSETPVHASAGLYSGKINFVMSGSWDLTVYIHRAQARPDTVVFANFLVAQ